MTRSSEATIVTITEQRALGESIARIINRKFDPAPDVRRLTYRECNAVLSPAFIEDADLCILDLFRTYPGGRRAEGVALGEWIARRDRPVLIISPLAIAETIDCHCYWDVSHAEELGLRIARLLARHYEPEDDLATLRRIFGVLMEIPPQHNK